MYNGTMFLLKDNEDIYNALDKLGEYDVLWLGGLDLYEY